MNKNKINECDLLIINIKINKKDLNFIINNYWNHCLINKGSFKADKFFESHENIISLYFANTSLDISEPIYARCVNWINLETQKLYFNEVYPTLYFNFCLYPFYKDIKVMDSLFGYKNIINTSIIINLLRQKKYYIPPKLEESKNLKKFIKEICNQGSIFSYQKYFDFTELIEAIKNTRFHYKNYLNSLFKIRAINYIINGDSSIHIFIEELINIISKIDRKRLNNLKNIKFKVYNKNHCISSKNNSKILNIQNEKKKNKTDIFKTIEKYYKFPGLPINGYTGHIPLKKSIFGISHRKIIKIAADKGFYTKEKECNLYRNNKTKKYITKIILDCEVGHLAKKNQKNKNIEKSNIESTLNNKKNKTFIKKNRIGRKKSVYEILKRYGNFELKKNLNEKIIEKLIKHEIYDIKDDLKEPIFLPYLFYPRYYMYNHHYYSKRHYLSRKKEILPNIFDSLFSIIKVGYTIEVVQNNISEILRPDMEEEDFENLINQTFEPKTKNEIPENYKQLLSLNNIYPSFG